MFDAYATRELRGSGDHDQASWLEDRDCHDVDVLATFSQYTAPQLRQRAREMYLPATPSP